MRTLGFTCRVGDEHVGLGVLEEALDGASSSSCSVLGDSFESFRCLACILSWTIFLSLSLSVQHDTFVVSKIPSLVVEM